MACLQAATFATREELLDEINRTRDLTDKPFGVNVSLFPALMPRPAEELIQTVMDSGVKILETAGRNPQPYRPQIDHRRCGFKGCRPSAGQGFAQVIDAGRCRASGPAGIPASKQYKP